MSAHGRDWLAGAGLALVAAGCTNGGISLDLRLRPDPNVNTEAQVIAAVESVVVVLDSPDGLYAPGEERVEGDVQIENADGDPALELVTSVPLTDHLPWIRVEQGSLDPDVVLDVRLLGLPSPGGDPIAVGTVSGVGFADGEVGVPFDLLPALLPPRVVDVIPDDGDTIPGCNLDRIVIVLNKPVLPGTALAEGAILFDPGGAPRSIRVDVSSRFIDVVPPAWSFTSEARYTLTVASSITDVAGEPLDQVPSLEGAQAYEHEFTLVCVP